MLKNTFIRLFNSPLKIVGFLTVMVVIMLVVSNPFFFFLGLYLIGIAILLYGLDFLARKFARNKTVFWRIQTLLTVIYVVLAFVVYMKSQEHNLIIFPKTFKGQAGIIFGIADAPELPMTWFWKKTILMPENGILITSTREEDMPTTNRFSINGMAEVKWQQISWDPNFAYDCIVCDAQVKVWLFGVDSVDNDKALDAVTSLCNEIAKGKRKSGYPSDHATLVNDDRGQYLTIMGRGYSSLPEGIDKTSVYKAILTGNRFTSVPYQILKMSTLEELVMAVNPIAEFPCNLSSLKRLKSITFAETKIRDISCDLSDLDSLNDLDLAGNQLTKVPTRIGTIPHLTWLSVNDNLLTDLSFLNNSSQSLETLNLYSNKIKGLSTETRFLKNLTNLQIFDNEIDSIPDNISDMKKLEKLDIWDNPIKYISPRITTLTKLKSLRLDDDFLTGADKENLRSWLPNCDIHFQTRRDKMTH
jgi:hypothetical protein